MSQLGDDRKKFYCREWAFQKLSHCLDQRPVSKTCGALLLGGPGCGKTTLCAELCFPSQGPQGRQQRTLNRRLLGYHFLQGHNEKSLSLSEFVRSLVTQILNHSTESHRERSIRRKLNKSEANISYEQNLCLEQEEPPVNVPVNARTLIADAYLEKLKSDAEIQIALRAKNIENNPDDCLKRALLFPLLEIDPPKTSLFLLIDSIDEHSFVYLNSTLTRSKPRERSSQSKTIAELLANHHHLFPQWLLLVCTARKQSKSIAKMFTGFRKLSLDDLRKSQVVRDVQQYILARLDQENSLRQHISRDTAEMLNQLHIKSNGCFLYLEKVLDGVSENFIALREVREIPGTLNGLYLWLCQRLFNRKQFARVQPLLNIILAAKCTLGEELLYDMMRISGVTREDFRKRFQLLRRVVQINNNGSLRLFHHSFAEWLLDIKHCTQKYLCNIYEGHVVLSMYYTLHAPCLSNREIYDFAFHLTRVEQFLQDSNKVKAKEEKRDRNSLVVVAAAASAGAAEVGGVVGVGGEEKKLMEECRKQLDDSKKLFEESLQNYEETKRNSEHLEFEEECHKKLETSEKNLEDCRQNLEQCREHFDDSNRHYEQVQLQAQEENKKCSSRHSKEDPIYAQVNKQHLKPLANSINNSAIVANPANPSKPLEYHTLVTLWLITSGCNVEECLLEGNEVSGVNFGAFLPTDPKVLRLLLDAGAVEPSSSSAAQNDEELDDMYERGGIQSHSSCCSEEQSPLMDAAPSDEADGIGVGGNAALLIAARLGQTHVVRLLLEGGADPDQADVDGWTPLRAAAWGGHTEVVELLVKHRCCLDSVDAENRTALRAASWSGHEEIVKILLRSGSNVNLTDHEGRTALIAAAYMGHAEIVEHLLDAGAHIDHADADGRTALSVAALCAPRTPGANVVNVLLERGATVDHKDKEGMTPLLVASFEGHKDVCELLLENEADVDHVDNGGRSPLWAAASMGHAPVVSLLLFWGCCIDAMDVEGRTVLSVAAAQGCAEVVRQLLDRGLDEQHRDNSGWTPLHYAAFEGHQEVCEALLENGARIDETDNEGKAPLALASQGGHASLVRLLIERYGAPYDQKPHDGKTALRLSALEGHYDIAQMLLGCGADIDMKDSDGRSTLYVLALDNRLAMAKFLVQQGADVETRDLEGRTPLHVAAWQGHAEMVRMLLEVGGARVDAVDLENRTALHSASWQGHCRIVRLLLEHRAQPDHTCNQGATALGIAAQEGHESCVVALLEHGADPNHSDACGRNAIRVAAKSGHRGVVRLLEEYNARSHKIAHTSSSANSITSGSTAETKPSCAVLYPPSAANEWCEQRRSTVSLGNHSSNSKSSSNLTGSSHSSSRHGTASGGLGGGADKLLLQQSIQAPPANSSSLASATHAPSAPISFTQQLQQCTRGAKSRPLSKVLSPLQSEPQSPIYASPPLSPVHDAANIFGAMNIYQPVLRQNNFAKAPDTHFARDTHMRIILGNNSGSGGGANGSSVALSALGTKADKNRNVESHNSSSSSGKPKRNGIVTNPALRLVANVKNGLDSAAANLRKSTSGGSSNPTTKTNSFHWRKETPL